MIFPTTSTVGLLLLIFGLVCWGTWGNTQKATGKWRYEFFCWDFALGALICAVAVAFTLGSMNSAELTFQDNFLFASYRRLAYGIAAGILFAFGNTFLLASASVSGISVAFPIALGLGVVVETAQVVARNPTGAPVLMMSGSLLLLAAVVVVAFALGAYRDSIAETAKKQALQMDPRVKPQPKKKKVRRVGAGLAVTLAVVSGIALGFVTTIIDAARQGENGVAPYSLAVLFAAGLTFATVVFSPFTINFPLGGVPAELRHYFKGSIGVHLWGLLGGILWMAGAIAMFVAAGSPAAVRPSPLATAAFNRSSPLLAMLFGLLVWREFQGANLRVKSLLWSVVVLYAAGVAMLALSTRFR
jgi:glucose uptake protein